MRARTTVTVVAVGAVLAAAAAVGGFALHSPDERITATVPPAVLTATVERTTLTTQLSGTGTFDPVASVSVSPAAPAGMAGIISATPRAVGDTLPWCTPLIEVSGRPLLVLHGELPAWRDLTVGDAGSDVRQLQTALRECGWDLTVDGVFGEDTARAIKALYAAAGYPAITSADAALGGGTPTTGGVVTTTSTGTASAGVMPASLVATITAATAEGDEQVPETQPADAVSDTGAPAPAPAPAPTPTVIAPRGELLFLPTTGRLTSIGTRGTALGDDAAATISLAGDRFTFALSSEQRTQLAEGMTVTVTRDDWTVHLALPTLSETATTDADGLPTYPVSVPLTEPVPGTFYGQSGQFTVTIGSPEPYACVVPVSAVYQDMSGQAYVLRVEEGAPQAGGAPPTARVDVEVVASAGGYSALRPLAEGALDTGDQVVIGEQ